MNIEDVIRRANPINDGDVPEGDSPAARLTLTRVTTGIGGPAIRHRARRGRRRLVVATGLAIVAAGTAAVMLVSSAPRELPSTAQHIPASHVHHHVTSGPTSARQVLLDAAAHVLSGPATGKYWRVQMISGIVWPAGTKAHPYDVSVVTGYDQWNPKSPGQREYLTTQQLAAHPATPADATAWRAAGSPATWNSGQLKRNNSNGYTLGSPWGDDLAATAVASPPSATWTLSNGTIGYVEGDLTGLDASQFARMPAQPRALAAVLRHYAKRAACSTPGCSSVDQIIWAEALLLLEDPVSAQVRAATFTVMASMPGVRLLGPMTDPLGRAGYGLAAGPQDPDINQNFSPVKAVLIDPESGSLLATEDIGPIPHSVRCWIQHYQVGGTVPKGVPVIPLGTSHGKRLMELCIGDSYLGRSYQGQVADFTVLVNAGWTSATPPLAGSATEDPYGSPGIPPAP